MQWTSDLVPEEAKNRIGHNFLIPTSKKENLFYLKDANRGTKTGSFSKNKVTRFHAKGCTDTSAQSQKKKTKNTKKTGQYTAVVLI